MKTKPLYVKKTFDAMLLEHGIVLDNGERANGIDMERVAKAVEAISGVAYDSLQGQHEDKHGKKATVREILLFSLATRWGWSKEFVRHLQDDKRRASIKSPKVFFDDLRMYAGAEPTTTRVGLRKETLGKGPTMTEYLLQTPPGKASV